MKLMIQNLKDSWSDLKAILGCLKKLQNSLQDLQKANQNLTKVSHTLKRSVKRYQFKNAVPLAKIDKIIKR